MLGWFLTYLEGVAQQSLALEGRFVHGDADDLTDETHAQFGYPLLWAETPRMVLEEAASGGNQTQYLTGVCVLTQAKRDDRLDRNAALELTASLAKQVVSKIKADAKAGRTSEGGFKLDLKRISFEEVNPLGADNSVGWRFELSLTRSDGLCLDSAQWQ
jgi:hypothetical protein